MGVCVISTIGRLNDNGLHADWKLQLGDRSFEVHKVIIARAAKVLSGSVSGSYATSGVTDLTKFHSQIT